MTAEAEAAPRRSLAPVVLAGVATVALTTLVGTVWPELRPAQRATMASLAREVEGAGLRTGVLVDWLLVVAYTTFAVGAFRLVGDPDDPARPHPSARAGIVLVALGAIADVVENAVLFSALDDPARPEHLNWMRAAGLVRWGALGSAALVGAALAWSRPWRRQADVMTRRRPADPPVPWDPPDRGGADERRIGVCLSGGGVRSAAFGLGALQALTDNDVLPRATYLAAVSGGGYMAAGWAVAHAGPPGDQGPDEPPRWSEGSPEERWFRTHSSYLVPHVRGGLSGVARMVAGIVVNLLVIWLVLFCVARPVGWLVHRIHPELAARNTAFVRDGLGEMTIGARLGPPATIADGGTQVERYEVDLLPAEDAAGARVNEANDVCLDLAPYRKADRDRCFALDQTRSALVDVRAGTARVVRQPSVAVAAPDCATDSTGCRLARTIRFTHQPRLALTTSFVTDQAGLRDALRIARQPTIRSESGLAAIGWPTWEWWMWELSIGLLVASLVLALGATTFRIKAKPQVLLRSLASALGVAGLVALAVTVALPWLTVWVPRTVASVFGGVGDASDTESPAGSGLADYLLPGGGFLAIASAAVRQLLSGGRQGSGTGPSTSVFGRITAALRKGSGQLKWYESSPSKVLLGVLVPVVGLVLFVGQLQYATGNGWSGRLMGFAFVREFLPYSLWPAEWVKLLLAAGVLGALYVGVDAHAWSLYPYYKRHLSSAYFVRRTGADRAEALDYDVLLPFDGTADGWHGLPKPGDGRGPQLVLGCAVNLSEYGVVPPGRRASSFTFSSTEVGGPQVGYATPAQYGAMPVQRRRDVTVPSAMAISGAAFSPAMGKFNLGPVGAVLALANLRLGVWLPNPEWVAAAGRPGGWWNRGRRPGWPWFLREVTNRYPFDHRFVYVSDGGHWDNLGLVELLRRGCTEIYCVSCAGDGAASFGTIGEAIALAREEVGVEISLDPSALRSPVGDPGPGRQLRRSDDKAKARTFAGKRVVPGTYTFTRSPSAPEGRLWYVEADLTQDLPFDVHTFAEAEVLFPDDSTADQVFNHRQFESYRRLGYHQAKAMGVDPADPADPADPEPE